MNHISLFSGIGGFDLAAEWMGWHNVAHCEINQFCNARLASYWPYAESYTDIKRTDFTKYAGSIDIITGGFPCQPYSVAGKRKGKEDERHLWPEMLRAIQEVRPRWVVGENVRGLISWDGGLVFREIQADLEGEGYHILPAVLPAAGIGADHKRERLWVIAFCPSNAASKRLQGYNTRGKDIRIVSGPTCALSRNSYVYARRDSFGGYSKYIRSSDGVSRKLDKERVKALGNAIVPQVAYQIFRTIELYDLLY